MGLGDMLDGIGNAITFIFVAFIILIMSIQFGAFVLGNAVYGFGVFIVVMYIAYKLWY